MSLEIQSDKKNTAIENFWVNFMHMNFSFSKGIVLVNQGLENRASGFGLNNVSVCATVSGIFECQLSCRTPDYIKVKKKCTFNENLQQILFWK